MRNRLVVTFAALLLASAHLAEAQAPPTKPAPPTVPSTGLFDVGVRGGPTDGDEARFERYRDLRPGATTMFQMSTRTDQYVFSAQAFNAGYRDQNYAASYYTGKFQATGSFVGIPLNYLYNAPLAWTSDGNGRFTLDQATRLAIQGPTNVANDGLFVGVPCAPGAPPASCTAATAPAAIANRSVYNQLLVRDDMQARRDTLAFTTGYQATPELGFKLDLTSTARTGSMPWTASYAFNNVNELAVPLDSRNNELKAGTEWANQKGMVRLDYWGSFFSNNIQTLTWDNPIRGTDFTNGTALPFDASGYSNGNGPASGQAALWPGNSLNAFGVTGMYKPLPRTTVNGNLQLTYMRQNETLLPWSTNTSINAPGVLAAYPGLRSLPRASAEAAVNGVNALITLNSRPTRYFTVLARYRYNQHENTTPQFDGRAYVTFDSAVRTFTDDPLTPHVEGFSEYFQIHRKNFDANGTFNLREFGSLRFGYANEQIDREGRGFSEVAENTFKASYDATLLQRLSVRASVDSGRRRGDGFILSGVDYEQGPAGTQPGLRYYDEADRDRTRGMVVLSANPTDMLGVFVQYTTTRDTFLGDESIPVGRQQFGLISQDVDAFSVGVDLTPNDIVSLGLNYGWDEFSALQRSRNANPPPDPSWTDPARNWELDNNEVVKTFMAYLDLVGLAQSKADVRLSYERNDSDNAFNYGGPRIPALQAAGTFIPLPNVVNEWNRFTADVKYFVTPKVGVGLGYWFDKLSVTDFNTIDTNGSVAFTPATGDPRIDWLGGLMTGYGNRPYKGGRFFVRMLYRF
jgi:MtrB/PioB family decaheme-associated outer membrane protein